MESQYHKEKVLETLSQERDWKHWKHFTNSLKRSSLLYVNITVKEIEILRNLQTRAVYNYFFLREAKNRRWLVWIHETYANVTLASSGVVLQRCDLQGFVWERYGFALNS